MTEPTVTLKPCPNPWCGAHKVGEDFSPSCSYAGLGNYQVKCPYCFLAGPLRSNMDAAGLAWNTRTASAPAGEVVATLYSHPKYDDEVELGTIPLTEGDKAAGWTETPLYAHPPAPADLVEAANALLTRCEMTTFSDQYPAECECLRAALAKHGGA